MANTDPPSSRMVAFAGLLSLGAAMGIGRFAFTPLLPLMTREGQLDLAWAGWIAAANYAGYFAGALSATRLSLDPRRLGLLGLLLTSLFTGAMAWPSAILWLVLRFAAGMASAWVFVATSLWCLGALAHYGQPRAAGWVYAGVGAGIAFTGLYCLAGAVAGWSAAALWLHLGAVTLLMTAPVAWVILRLPAMPTGKPDTQVAVAERDGEARGLIACYGLMGFGYILPATFLPALARTLTDDPRWFGLAWPVFGLTAAASTVLAGWLFRRATRLRVWACSQVLMGLGALLPSLWLNGATIAASALLVGGTFMVITLAGVQEMRFRAPAQAQRLVARITAAFALGQIAGPIASALMLQVPALAGRGLALPLQAAGICLLASGAWLWRRSRIRSLHKETVHSSGSAG